MTQSMTAPPEQFHFGIDYIREHFGSNVALATQQMAHNRYRSNLQPLVDHIFASLELTGRESLLDVGCGNGFILRDIVSRMRDGGRVVALDISPAMLELAKRNVTVAWVPLEFTEGNANDLSRYADGAFDRVMANYIFHYIDEPDTVLSELRRVTAADGRALVTIEARHSMPEMYAMHFEAMERVGFPADFIGRLPRGRRGVMTLDNTAEYAVKHFSSVEERPYADALRFVTPEPFMNFYVAGHRYCGALPKADDTIPRELFDALHADVERQVSARIAERGYFELTKHNSVFVCS
ncbi:methyltransferase domain-containing protein [Streptomyces xiamenensis]|uniref:class I SAM-dependent methyltransferase n=1 Tax=Streptomyces xiamenensis TaxID=408015 RepID=UPI00341365EE